MKAKELIELLRSGGLEKYSSLYDDIPRQTERFIAAIEAFSQAYGEDRDVAILSVPGRSEIIGNHTDHNHGKVMAGAINRDIVAVAAKNGEDFVSFCSEGYSKDRIFISAASDPERFKKFTSRALIAGMMASFIKAGHNIGGLDVYCCTEVLKGSGLSSSAAFEVMIGNVLNHLFCDGKVDNQEIAKYAQYSENVYFGKPCGLMDQMACAVGGFVYIDFEDNKNPVVQSVDLSLAAHGYSLCIVNTGGNHANLNADYASVPAEMKAVAKALGREVLRGLSEEDIVLNAQMLRRKVGDRAILRAIHFVRENGRVEAARDALIQNDLKSFYDAIMESGRSSFQYLQNLYTTQNVSEQGLSLAIALTDGFVSGRAGAFRVHGGGFAGTIQAFVPLDLKESFRGIMDGAFGAGACAVLNIRPEGAIKVEI
jgi:galactokinase